MSSYDPTDDLRSSCLHFKNRNTGAIDGLHVGPPPPLWKNRKTIFVPRLRVLSHKSPQRYLSRYLSGAEPKKDMTCSFRIHNYVQGPVSRNPRNLRARKENFSSPESKNGEIYKPETSCMKGASVHIKNTSVKQLGSFYVCVDPSQQLCNRKARDFAMAFRARKVSGAFEKRAPAHQFFIHRSLPGRA